MANAVKEFGLPKRLSWINFWKRSARSSITLWFVTILAAILAFCGTAVYLVVSYNLEHNLDDALRLETKNISGSIFSFWRAEKTAKGTGAGNWSYSPVESLSELASSKDMVIFIRRWNAKVSMASNDHTSVFRILDHAGNSVLENESLFFSSSLSQGTFYATLGSPYFFYSTLVSSGIRYRLLTYPVMENGEILYYLQVVSSMEHIDSSKKLLKFGLILVIPWTVLIVSFFIWGLVSRIFKPVDNMTRQVKMINASRLDRRIDVPQTGDELERLALTFNFLLEKIEDSLKRLRQFSAAASHELRTPLTIMKGELELLLARPRDIQEYKRVFQTHLQTINELTEIVKELLALARCDAITEVLSSSPLVLNDLVAKAEQNWETVAITNRIAFAVRSCEDSVWVNADRNLLERLLANLLDNAFKHTPDGGKITLELSHLDDEARISVYDTGPGITEEEIPAIFDRFFSKRQDDENGNVSGLGLGLCRWIAEIHHGRIEVRNGVYEGAIFTFFLPIKKSSNVFSSTPKPRLFPQLVKPKYRNRPWKSMQHLGISKASEKLDAPKGAPALSFNFIYTKLLHLCSHVYCNIWVK